MSFGTNHHYLECVKSAYEFASAELLNLIKDKVIFSLFPIILAYVLYFSFSQIIGFHVVLFRDTCFALLTNL